MKTKATLKKILMLCLALGLVFQVIAEAPAERIIPLRFYDTVEYEDAFQHWQAEQGWTLAGAELSQRSTAWTISNANGNERALTLAGVFDLHSAVAPKATWYESLLLNSGAVRVEARVLGEHEWDILLVRAGAQYGAWQQHVVSLEAYIGQLVEFRFVYERGDGYWYIDDIDVLDWVTENQAPQSQIQCEGLNANNQAVGTVTCEIITQDSDSPIQSIVAYVNDGLEAGALVELSDISPYQASLNLGRVERRGNQALIQFYAIDSFGNQETMQSLIIAFESPRGNPTNRGNNGNQPTAIILTPLPSQATLVTETEPAQTEPVQTEPAETEPAQTEPAETQTSETEPAETEPTGTEPNPTEPAQTEPVQTEPAETEPVPTEPVPTQVPVITIVDLVNELNTLCQEISNPGICNSLENKLERAQEDLGNGDSDYSSALQHLQTFVSELEDLPAHLIPPERKSTLLSMAEDLIQQYQP